MKKDYFIIHKGKTLGPWNFEDVLRRIISKEISIQTDDYYEGEDNSTDLSPLLSHPLIVGLYKIYKNSIELKKSLNLSNEHKDSTETSNPLLNLIEEDPTKEPLNSTETVLQLDTDEIFKSLIVETSENTEDVLIKKNNVDIDFTNYTARSNIRVPYDKKVLVNVNGNVLKGQGINVSVGGMQFTSDSMKIPKGIIVTIRINPSEQPKLLIRGKIAYSKELKKNEYLHGLEFTQMTKSSDDYLKKHIYACTLSNTKAS